MRCATTLRLLFCSTLLAACAVAPSRGQSRIVPRERLDSLAHPATAPGAEAMRFDRMSIDAGRIGEEQTPPSYLFRWTNAGEKPLVVTRVSTTCGCAVPAYDRRPVRAGESGEITVTYRPKGHPGSFDRRIFVYTQLSAKYPTAILNLRGTVVPSGQSADGFPVSMGALQLSRTTVRFDARGEVQQAHIACRNAGSETLRIGCDANLLPAGFEAVCEPAALEPGAEGRLTLRYDPPADARAGQAFLRLTGLGLPPSKSTIRILLETE